MNKYQLAVWLALMLTLPAWAESGQGVDWASLDHDTRKVLKPFANKWQDLSSARQQKVLRGAQQWRQPVNSP